MARKLSRASHPRHRSGLRSSDIAAGLAVATAGGFVCATSVGSGIAAHASSREVAAWLLTLLGYTGFVVGGIALIRADLLTHTLPNQTVAAVALWTAGALSIASVALGEWAALGAAWGAAIATLAVAFVCWWATAGALGGGDAKLLPIAVFATVWAAGAGAVPLSVGLFLMLLAGAFGLAGLVALIRRRREFAAGPAIFCAAIGGVALAPVLAV